MAIPRLKVILIEQGVPRQLMGKAITQILKMTMEETGIAWHTGILPLHFEPNADVKYNYRQRTRRWVERKERKGIRDQLVWTGNLRRAMESSRKVTSTRARARVSTPGAPHLHFHGKDKEIARSRADDVRSLERAGNAAMQRAIDRVVASIKTEGTVIS